MSCDYQTMIDNLCTSNVAISAEIAAMDATKAGGLPNRASEGINVDHDKYRDRLSVEMNKNLDMIAKLEMKIDGSIWDRSVGTG